ncbi:MAG: ATP synthase subunit I [Thiohalomonadaceae bacterium]
MNYAAAQRQAKIRILLGQFAIIASAALAFGVVLEPKAGAAALFGSLIVILNSLMHVWQLKRADRIAGREAGSNLRYLFRCTLERYMVTVALFATGFVALQMAALPLISGFIIGHVAMVTRWFFESGLRRRRHG